MFIHGGWLHILGNMWFLWIFGRGIEDILGHAKFLVFLPGLRSGGGNRAHPGERRLSSAHHRRQRRDRRSDGRVPGEVSARPHRDAGLYSDISHHRRLPAAFLLLYWFAIQFFNGVGSVGYSQASSGNVAWFAHVAGFVAGIGLILLMPTKHRARPWY